MRAIHLCSDEYLSPAATDSTFQSALAEWKVARTLLADSIQTYLAACTTLRAIFTTPLHEPSQRPIIEKLLVTVDSELGSLLSEENALHDMRVSLVTARNNLSTTLVPINTLPPEILTNIFARSMTCCIQQDRHLHSFTGVCAYWRQISMQAAYLWSHVDVGPGTSENMINLLLERSKEAPIHVHLHEPKSENNEPTSEQEISKVLRILSPHVLRIYSLDIESYSYSRGFVGAMLNLWLEGGNPSLAKSLVVYRPNASMLLSPDGYGRHVTLFSRSDNARSILKSLSKLHLQNVAFDWGSGTYGNLVNLQLSCFCAPTTIPISQIADILSENPALSVLKLSSVTLTRPHDWTHPAPIALNHLKVLNLFHLDLDSLRLFLPLIRSPNPVEIGVGPAPFNLMHRELKDFLSRSCVAALYCWQDKSHSFPTWTPLLNSLPSLHSLVLDEFNMDDGPVTEASSGTSQPPLLPRLPSILLLDCTITLEGVKTLIADYAIEEIRFERCKLLSEEDKGLENTRKSLLEAYPELRCTISDVPSTGQLDYCRIFDR